MKESLPKLPEVTFNDLCLKSYKIPSWDEQAPKFSTWEEIAAQDATQGQSFKPRGSQRLFSALLGDPRRLYAEYLEDPARFDEQAAALIQQLVANQRKISDLEERELDLLDQATLEFARPRRQQKAPEVKAPKALQHLTQEHEEEEPLAYLEDGTLVPLSVTADISPPAETPEDFWWKD